MLRLEKELRILLGRRISLSRSVHWYEKSSKEAFASIH